MDPVPPTAGPLYYPFLAALAPSRNLVQVSNNRIAEKQRTIFLFCSRSGLFRKSARIAGALRPFSRLQSKKKSKLRWHDARV